MTEQPKAPQQYGTPEQKAAAGKQYAETAAEKNFGFSDIAWRDQMIRGLRDAHYMIHELREALKFYADERNYNSGVPVLLGLADRTARSGFEDRQISEVDSDNGKIAREALGKR